ncbi:MAG: hypothetical protein KKD46_05645, partial [Euryarchaeota archaeon]|nr:hypothetical protein [Euryarchaeota archaeon]
MKHHSDLFASQVRTVSLIQLLDLRCYWLAVRLKIIIPDTFSILVEVYPTYLCIILRGERLFACIPDLLDNRLDYLIIGLRSQPDHVDSMLPLSNINLCLLAELRR